MRLAVVTVLLAGCSTPDAEHAPAQDALVPGTPPTLRVAAEWEPALGVLVSWPPYLPRQLFVELAHDTRLYVLVGSAEASDDARAWFDAWGIDPGRVEFLEVPTGDDAAWPRDYGPHPVFTSAGDHVMADTRYDQSTPITTLACDAPLRTPFNGGWGMVLDDFDITNDDAAPTAIAAALGVEARELSCVLTGGNFLTDGRGGAFSTCVLTNENRSNGLEDEAFFELVRNELGIDRYHVIPNYEDMGIQHVDCLLKPLEGDRLLVARPPRDHHLFERYETLVNEHLERLRAADGQPYEILRIDTARYSGEHLAAYTNSLVLDDTVYVPMFGIPEDAAALVAWQEALPGYVVKGIHFVTADEPALAPTARRMFPGGLGWRSFDALHCRTRAVWDPQMLYIAVDRPPRLGEPDVEYVVTAEIVPYSGEPLLANRLKLHWRIPTEDRWQERRLERGPDGRFRAPLPAVAAGAEIEFYVGATDASGRTERSPRTAPRSAYRIDVPR